MGLAIWVIQPMTSLISLLLRVRKSGKCCHSVQQDMAIPLISYSRHLPAILSSLTSRRCSSRDCCRQRTWLLRMDFQTIASNTDESSSLSKPCSKRLLTHFLPMEIKNLEEPSTVSAGAMPIGWTIMRSSRRAREFTRMQSGRIGIRDYDGEKNRH